MRGADGNARSWRWALIAIAVLVLLISGGVESCRSLLFSQQPLPTASPTPFPTASPTLLPSPTPVSQTVAGTPAPTEIPKISQDEAQTVVSAWFNSILAQDYDTAVDLTAGRATEHTEQLANGFKTAIGTNAVELVGQRIDLKQGPPQSDGSQAVRADFDILVNARVGPIMVRVQRLAGNATFIVGRVGARTRITEITDVTGLPGAR